MKRAILGVSLGLALLLAAIAPAHGAPASEFAQPDVVTTGAV